MTLLKISNSSKLVYKKLTLLKKKKIWKQSQIFLLPGQAKVAPPISSTLGQFGINLIEFCDKFNSSTKFLDPDIPVAVRVIVFQNKTFLFDVMPVSLNELAFSLDLNSVSLNLLASSADTDMNSFIISFYKFYLCFAHLHLINANSSLFSSSDFLNSIPTLLGYLRSYKVNH